MNKAEMEARKDIREWMIAKCPLCGKEHKEYLYWTGRGVPRKYCKKCRRLSSFLTEQVYHMRRTA